MDTAVVPYTRDLRVLNPPRQATRFDRDGDFVRRYVPELAAPVIHTPWKLPGAQCRQIRYPEPLIDLGS